MDIKSAAKVGLLVLIGVAALFWGWRFLSHNDPNRFTLYADFDDVKGIQPQSPLRMNGVKVGEVKEVGFRPGTLKPRVTLGVDKKYESRIPADSGIRITSGLLIQNAQIEIVPGRSGLALVDGSTFPRSGEAASGLAQLSPEADLALKQLTLTIQDLRPKLAITLDSMQGILKRTELALNNVQGMTASAKSLISDPEIRLTMHETLSNLRAVAADARLTARSVSFELRGLVKRNSAKFDDLTNGAVDLLQKFADTVDAARGALTKLTEQVSDPRLQQSLLDTVDLAKATLARFNQIASDIHNLTGDPTVQNDLKSTLSTLKETTEEGQKVVKRVGDLVGTFQKRGGPRFGIGKPELSIDFLGRSDKPYFRSDLGLRLPIGDRNALNLGLYDFAEKTKLNAQYETKLTGLGALRYGLYASKLGIGFDWGTKPGTNFRLDAYDPNNPRLDARALLKINEDFSLWLGADSLFKKTTPLIGVRLTR
jgi:ABC-type transport system involved in resistance to organic solvents, periplasmic component